MRLLSIQHALIRNNMFIKSSKIFLPTCLFRPTCRVELDILLCKSTKKYPIIKFWMAFEQNWYPQLILCVISGLKFCKFLASNMPTSFSKIHIPTNMFIPSMDVMKVDGPAGFWIFCKSYLEPKSSKVLVISFEHL